jgi:hypothetical protein
VKKSGKRVRKRFKIQGLGADLQPLTTDRDCKVLKLKGLRIKPADGAERVCERDQKDAGPQARQEEKRQLGSRTPKKQTSFQLV